MRFVVQGLHPLNLGAQEARHGLRKHDGGEGIPSGGSWMLGI